MKQIFLISLIFFMSVMLGKNVVEGVSFYFFAAVQFLGCENIFKFFCVH